ncbi:hypothetical protein [Corynebacterium sp.]|uniref:hypothetical protein n=1 Tax=Corynebacterium sp. TaxID=1720 RepID=UPI0025C3237E|nr:hypothetical protein [Corynebacterium sp.]
MNTHDNLHDPVVIDDDGITVDGKPLLVEKDSVSVLQDYEHGLTFVTLTLITDNLTVATDSQRAREQLTVRGSAQA